MQQALAIPDNPGVVFGCIQDRGNLYSAAGVVFEPVDVGDERTLIFAGLLGFEQRSQLTESLTDSGERGENLGDLCDLRLKAAIIVSVEQPL